MEILKQITGEELIFFSERWKVYSDTQEECGGSCNGSPWPPNTAVHFITMHTHGCPSVQSPSSGYPEDRDNRFL
jgi:hypothetical protein